MPSEMSRKDIVDVISKIYAFAGDKNYKAIEKELETIAVDTDPQMIVTLLRSSFFCKQHLSNYDTQAKKASAYLLAQGLDPKTVLTGLVEK